MREILPTLQLYVTERALSVIAKTQPVFLINPPIAVPVVGIIFFLTLVA